MVGACAAPPEMGFARKRLPMRLFQAPFTGRWIAVTLAAALGSMATSAVKVAVEGSSARTASSRSIRLR
jgi:hypothetical protein